jgi:hypothetical protein
VTYEAWRILSDKGTVSEPGVYAVVGATVLGSHAQRLAGLAAISLCKRPFCFDSFLTAKELNSASSSGGSSGGLRHDLLSMAVQLELEKLEAFCKQQQQMEMQMQWGSHADNLGGGGGEGAVVFVLVMLVESFMHSISAGPSQNFYAKELGLHVTNMRKRGGRHDADAADAGQQEGDEDDNEDGDEDGDEDERDISNGSDGSES